MGLHPMSYIRVKALARVASDQLPRLERGRKAPMGSGLWHSDPLHASNLCVVLEAQVLKCRQRVAEDWLGRQKIMLRRNDSK